LDAIDSSLIIYYGAALLCLGPLILAGGLFYLFRTDRLSERIDEYVARPSGASRPRGGRRFNMPARNLTGSIGSRIFIPAIRSIGNVLGRLTPVGSIDGLNQKLTVAGNPMGLGAREFYGIKLGFMFLGMWLAFYFITRGFDQINLLAAFLSVIVTFLLPQSWLDRKVRERQDKVRKNLPDALDMLSVCVTAGLGFDQALQRVNEHWETPISAEFGRVLKEIEMGLSRRDALRNMVDRLDVAEVSSFVSFVLQTEQLGMSISETLQTQAEQMRVMRRMRAQEQAQKAPTKMLLPMVFLIFPAILAIILGPVVPTMMEFFGTFN
jgi:tight adherence protein C